MLSTNRVTAVKLHVHYVAWRNLDHTVDSCLVPHPSCCFPLWRLTLEALQNRPLSYVLISVKRYEHWRHYAHHHHHVVHWAEPHWMKPHGLEVQSKVIWDLFLWVFKTVCKTGVWALESLRQQQHKRYHIANSKNLHKLFLKVKVTSELGSWRLTT